MGREVRLQHVKAAAKSVSATIAALVSYHAVRSDDPLPPGVPKERLPLRAPFVRPLPPLKAALVATHDVKPWP